MNQQYNELPLVSREQAILLQQAGFNWGTLEAYTQKGNMIETMMPEDHNTDSKGNCFSCPTLAIAVTWLRTKGYHCYAECDLEMEKWYPRLFDKGQGIEKFSYFNNHDDAVSLAVRMALEQIIQLKQNEKTKKETSTGAV